MTQSVEFPDALGVVEIPDDLGAVEFDLNEFDGEFTHCFTGECRVNMLPILFRINKAVTANTDFSRLLAITLDVMRERLRMNCGAIMLYDRSSETIFVQDSFGLDRERDPSPASVSSRYMTGTVVETGKAVVIPRQSREGEASSGRAAKRKANIALICVPITHADKVLGTICAERAYVSQRLLQRDVEFLAMIASMLAPRAELYLIENIDKARLETENQHLRDALKERFKPSNIIGNSKPMREVYDLIHKVAATKATVLILGESGVGKELVANAIHYNSPSAEGPFIKANCAALPEALAESELFGHERGSFTGAVAMHKGRFEQADGGTLFLDEVGELSLTMQAKLLRVLQEKTFERVGGVKPITIDVRIIAATNRDLAAMVEAGEFREDLFYRLNVFPITIPPLRERGSDVITLADHFVSRFAEENGGALKRISAPALDMLMNYHWPGNVRELENVIERAAIMTEGSVIHGYDLPPSLQASVEDDLDEVGVLEAKVKAVEYEMIVEALRNNRGNIGAAALELGLTRRMLGLRMKRYDINHKPFRTPSMLEPA